MNRPTAAPRFITYEPLREPRRVIMLDEQPSPCPEPERRSFHRGPRSCESHGICKDRYPHCGQCDDPHPEDEPPTPSPFEQIYGWCIAAAIAAVTVSVVGVLALAAGATVYAIAQLLP